MKLFFRKYGTGPAIFILHGLYGSSDNWIHIARALGNRFTVILPDMRNHGRSPWSDDHSYELMSGDVIELADDLGIPDFFIAGHSMGGKTASILAVNNPLRVSGLFIGDISPFPYSADGAANELHREILRIMNTVDPAMYKFRSELEEYLTTLAGEKTTRLVFAKNIIREKGQMKWRLNAAALLSNIDRFLEGINRPSDAVTDKYYFPVIMLKGDRSIYIEERDIDDLIKVFPHANVRIAENCGHWIHTDNPTAVINSLEDLVALKRRKESH